MTHISRAKRCWTAIAIWVAGVALFAICDWWSITSAHVDAENRLISEAGRTASQISSLLSQPGHRLDAATAKAMIAAAMEDERIYAVQIRTRQGLKEGQRRNYLWEPVAWDEEIAENCVQGIDPIRIDGKNTGTVEVWLSPRINHEEAALLDKREQTRLILSIGLWTAALLLLLWHWGIFQHLKSSLTARTAPEKAPPAENIILGLGKSEPAAPEATAAKIDHPPLIRMEEGRKFCHSRAGWPIIAGLFRQTFGRAPALMSRLYAENETPGLCHLGRMLEQAAPCVGASQLQQAAHAMQSALNDPQNRHTAIDVDNCAKILEQTLEALSASNWHEQDNSHTEKNPPEQQEA